MEIASITILPIFNTSLNTCVWDTKINSFSLSPSGEADCSIGQQTDALVWDNDVVLTGCLLVREVDVRYPEIADVRRRNNEGGDGFRVGEASVFPAKAKVERQLIVLISRSR